LVLKGVVSRRGLGVCRPPVRGVQFHHPVPAAVDGSEEVGKDYKHASADLQVHE
jgi:hypothetical protein